MDRYSNDIVEQITQYFKKKYNILITKEEAEEYLDSLADLFLIFNDGCGGQPLKP